ncbi:MAG: hypothetical protein ACI9BD_000107 [Candidatus Marinamargulisbacteria bacterium]
MRPIYPGRSLLCDRAEKVSQYKPKVVFVCILWPWKPFKSYSNHDAWKEIDFDFYKETIPLRSKKPEPWRYILKTPRRIKNIFYTMRFKDEVARELTRPGIRDFEISKSGELALAQDHVDAFQDAITELKDAGTKVVFYIHPYQYTLFNKKYEHLGKSGKELFTRQLNAIDMGVYLKKAFNGNPLFMDNCHMLANGHQAFFDVFTKLIRENIGVVGQGLK